MNNLAEDTFDITRHLSFENSKCEYSVWPHIHNSWHSRVIQSTLQSLFFAGLTKLTFKQL